MADSCEAYFNGKWNIIDIQTALEYPQLTKRCVECYGEVRIHKKGGIVTEHAEHKIGFKYCSLGHYYKGGVRKMHPNPAIPVKAKIKLIPKFPEEVIYSKKFTEGKTIRVLVNYFERDSAARKECIKIYGYNCSVCNIKLEEIYGVIAKNFIHVHHLRPLSSMKKKYKVYPKKDLKPICPNCHAIIHLKDPPYSINKVKGLVRKEKNN